MNANKVLQTATETILRAFEEMSAKYETEKKDILSATLHVESRPGKGNTFSFELKAES